jgi:hypothetical protein
MRRIIFLLVGFACIAACAKARAAAPQAVAEYGLRARYVDGVLLYPDFAIRFVRREDLAGPEGTRVGGGTRFIFEILDRNGAKVGGFSFMMSGTYESTHEF